MKTNPAPKIDPNLACDHRGYRVEILADSIAPNGSRLTTFRLRYPRWIHSELLTHRTHSRNAGSSRAIPGKILRRQVIQDPAQPVFWGMHQRGMQASVASEGWRNWAHRQLWFGARIPVVCAHWGLDKLGLHKQLLNRIIEPWMWMESIWSATDPGWDNWFHQRCHKDAQPEFQWLSLLMLSVYHNSQPRRLTMSEWHLPYGDGDTTVDGIKAAIGRIARVSYHNDDKIKAREEQLALYEKLAKAEDDGDPPHLCYDESTEVLTKHGFKLWSKVTADDALGTWNPDCQSLVYERPKALHRSNFTGDMYRVDHAGVDLLVTPNHKMFVSHREKKKWTAFQLIEAQLLGDRTMIRYKKTAPLKGEVSFPAPPMPIDDVSAFLQFCGFFIGDGHARRDLDQSGRRSVQFNLRKKRKIDYILDIAARLGWEARQHTSTILAAEGLAAWCREQFYADDGEKRFPKWVLELPEQGAEAVLDGLRNSDGSEKRRSWTFCTTSSYIESGFEQLVLHAGGCAHRMPSYGHGNFTVLSQLKPVINQTRKNTRYEAYDGPVFCATVSSGILVVRRNGKTVLSGNSPMEHVAQALGDTIYKQHLGGNFGEGWHQWRKMIELKPPKADPRFG